MTQDYYEALVLANHEARKKIRMSKRLRPKEQLAMFLLGIAIVLATFTAIDIFTLESLPLVPCWVVGFFLIYGGLSGHA